MQRELKNKHFALKAWDCVDLKAQMRATSNRCDVSHIVDPEAYQFVDQS